VTYCQHAKATGTPSVVECGKRGLRVHIGVCKNCGQEPVPVRRSICPEQVRACCGDPPLCRLGGHNCTDPETCELWSLSQPAGRTAANKGVRQW